MVVAAPPRTKLLHHNSWDGIGTDVARAVQVHTGWSGSVSAILPGLRGTGRCVRNPSSLTYTFNTGGNAGLWNTGAVYFDFRYTAGSFTNGLLVELLNGVLQLNILSTGKLQMFNVSTSQVWTSARTMEIGTGFIRKVECLYYIGQNSTGYFQVWIEGLLWIEAYNVNIGTTNLQAIKWNNTSIDIDDFALFVGLGGWTDGDHRSDTNGNPRILQLTVDGAGAYTDGTPNGGPASSFDCVNEALFDTADFARLVWAGAAVRDGYTLVSLPGTVTRVLGVSALFMIRTTTAGQALSPRAIRMNPEAGIGYDSLVREPALSTYSSTSSFTGWIGGWWRKNPATGREFTVTDVNGMEIFWVRDSSLGGTNWDVAHAFAEVLCYVSPPAAQVVGTPQTTLLQSTTHRRSCLWTLWPRWGAPMFFTDASHPITITMVDGQTIPGRTYVPAGAFSASEERRELGLKEADIDIKGVISSAAITVSDIRAGRYSQARLIQEIVDWRYPDFGALKRKTWTIEAVDEYDGESWMATLSGITARLKEKVGDAYYPRCRFNLYDRDYAIAGILPTPERGCKLDAMGYGRGFTVNSATDRRVFDITVNSTPSLPANWFTDGILVFTLGANANIVGEIKSMPLGTGGTVNLQLPLPFAVSAAESGMIWPGCNLLIGTVNVGDCEDKFDNVRNYGGFMLIPGTDETMRGSNL